MSPVREKGAGVTVVLVATDQESQNDEPLRRVDLVLLHHSCSAASVIVLSCISKKEHRLSHTYSSEPCQLGM